MAKRILVSKGDTDIEIWDHQLEEYKSKGYSLKGENKYIKKTFNKINKYKDK